MKTQLDQLPLRINPWIALGVLVLIYAITIPLVLKLHFNNVPDLYSPKDSPVIKLRQELLKEFPNDEVLFTLFEGDNLYTPEFLSALNRVANRLKKDPLVDRVLTVTTVEHIEATEDGFSAEPLIDPDNLEKRSPDEWRDRVLADAFAPGLVASEDGRAIGMAIRPVNLDESWARKKIKDEFYAAVKAEKLDKQLTAVSGPMAETIGELESLLRDTAIFVPLTSAIGLGLLWWVVGRVRPVLIGAAVMTAVVLVSVAALVVAGQPYTPIAAMIPTLMAAYTIATLLHLYAGIQRGRVALLPRYQRISRALHETFSPGLFNVLTTSAGMGSLAFATIPPMQVFGLAGALGSLTVFLMVYLIVPPILLRWDIPRWPRRSSGMSHARHVAARMTFFSMRHAKAILIVTVLCIIASIPLIMNVKVETDMIKFFSPNHPMTIGTKRLEEKLSGITTMEVVLTGTGRDSLKDPDTLKRIESLQNWIKSLPEVDHAFSMVDVIKRMNRAFNGDAPSFDTLPSDRKLIEQYLLIYDGKDLYENVNREYQRGLMVVNLHVHGAQEVSHVIRAIQDHIQTNPILGIQVQMSGFGKLFSDQVKMIVDSQVNSFSGAFIQIFLLMALLWRSIPSAIISLIPNLVPLFFIFVLMGATGIYLDVATALIAGVVLGITVDDTIHLYHGYLHRRKKGISAVFSIARSFESSGRAVLAVSVILVAQFLLLTLSDYNPTMHFGLLCAIGLASGQIFEMLLMPALMVWKDVKPGHVFKAQ